jgi:vacuolar-type H+-ATPase subunit D/Vma8|tara:strand:+ start:6838 stop:7098 length:261 start_codon:yes stop_codon:yes gene_type:complete
MTKKKQEVNKITDKELELVQDQQRNLNKALGGIGVLEMQKSALVNRVNELEKEVEETKKELEQVYGNINIDLSDGSFTFMEQENDK